MFDPAVFAARRAAYMDAIGVGAIAIARSQPERLRNGDAYHPFRQNSDVLYLTGFAEPGCTLLLRPAAEHDKVVMFVRPRDPELETWDGRRAGLEGAKDRYGADVAYDISELDTKLAELTANVDEWYVGLGIDDELDALVARTIARLRRTEKKGQRPPRAVVDPREALHELRLIKRPEELAALRKASAIAGDAHIAAIRHGRPGVFEYELEAIINYQFRRRGGSGPGYATIVGAGENAMILHYIENRCAIADGDLVLVDAGCEYEHYTADITRTWPANGTFSPAQKQVYEIVLSTQVAAIDMARIGTTIDDIHQFCVRALTGGMIALGLLAGPIDERIKDLSYRRFYMHGTSHWLGLDVHDAGAYTRDGKPRPLEAGMVITIEPGLYIAQIAEGVPDELRGIGVRIEDDIVITNGSPEVLTAGCPKSVRELEALAKS